MMLFSFFANYFILARKPVSRVRHLQSLAKLLALLMLTQGCHNPINIGLKPPPVVHHSRESDEHSLKSLERAAIGMMEKDLKPAKAEDLPSKESSSSTP